MNNQAIAQPLDWANFEGPKRNPDWKPDDQDLIYTAINFRDDEYGDADEDAGQQIAERLLAAWKLTADSEQLTFEISARLLRERDEAREENAKLRKMMASLDWYWPEDDTSSEACADGPWQIAENHDTEPGEVFGYSRGGVIETRYFGYLEPADDADSDDNFEVDEPTREAAEAKIAAELSRRAALKSIENLVLCRTCEGEGKFIYDGDCYQTCRTCKGKRLTKAATNPKGCADE